MTGNEQPPFTPLIDRISFLVHRINAQLLRQTNPRLKVWDVDLTESRLLVALLELGPLTAGDLVRVMALPQSTVSHQVKRLEKRGYVTRVQDAKDSRVIITQLTDSGREIAHQADSFSREVALQVASAINNEQELAVVRAALKRIDETLAKNI